MTSKKKRKKKFAVLKNGEFVMNTIAVSSEKAINNVRYRMFLNDGSWLNVPAFCEFDVIEL